jgi:ribose transport system substrate-binding protein
MTAVVAMAVALAACGSSTSSSSSSSTKVASNTTSSSGLSAETQKSVDTAYKGSFGAPPPSGPKAQKGKNIWVIEQSAQASDLTAPGQIPDAAKLLGWHLTLFDGKYDPSTWVTGIRQAIAAKADGIILFAVDCAATKAALQQAKQAGVPIVGWEDIDCNQTITKTGEVQDTGQPGLFSAALTYPDPANPSKQLSFANTLATAFPFYQLMGLINGTQGKAKLIKLRETDAPITLDLDAGVDKALEQYCPGCQTVDTINFVGTDIGPPLQAKIAQALVQHPEANAIYSPYGAVTPSAAAAVMASGRKDKIFVQGGEGTAAEAELIGEGRGVNAAAGYSVAWEGWAALDAMNRLLSGQKPSGAGFPSGLGVQLVDKDHNLPPKGKPYQPPVDFRAAYQKVWGG